MENAFLGQIAPRLREALRVASAYAGLESAEADRQSMAAIRAASMRHMRSGNLVAAYDWDGLFAEVCLAHGVEPGFTVTSLYEAACKSEGNVRLLPGAREALEHAKELGARVVAITNGYRAYQWPVLTRLQVADLFDEVITPEGAGYAKPDPRVFEAVPNLRLHVGDVLLADVLGANLAGIPSILVDDELPEHLRVLDPFERPHDPSFAVYVEAALKRSPYIEVFPQATVENCTPQAATWNMHEVMDLLPRFVQD